MTSGGPEPTSWIFMPSSISQRLAGLERVLHPLLRLALGHQAHERFAFEIQEMLLAHHRRVGEIASRHDGCQLATDQRVVIADATRAPRQMDAELERRQHRITAD